MNAPHELTTTDLRAEIAYRRRGLEAHARNGRPRVELERELREYELELRRRERYTKAPERTDRAAGPLGLCNAEHPELVAALCQRLSGHEGRHVYTSSADGRSVDWPA